MVKGSANILGGMLGEGIMKRYYTAPSLRKAGTLSAVTAQQGSSNFKEETAAG